MVSSLTENFVALLEYEELTQTRTDKVISLAKKEFFTVSPLIFLPAASVLLDGGLTAAIWGGLKLSIGIKGLDMSLDFFMNNAKKVISPPNLFSLWPQPRTSPNSVPRKCPL